MFAKEKVGYSNMLNYIMLNHDYMSNDHMARISKEARLYYIELMFNSNCGFVANPIKVLDSMGFDKSVLQELISNGEILTLEGRDEVFLAAFYIHNHKFKMYSWLKTPFAHYWKGKLWIKKNGVATLKVKDNNQVAPHKSSVAELEQQVSVDENMEINEEINPNATQPVNSSDWESLVKSIEKA